MKLRLAATGIPDLIPMARSGDPSRHVSAVIRYLCLKLGHFDDDGGVITPEQQTRMELGSTFEDAMIAALAARYVSSNNRYVQPGELFLDGMIGTPDLLDVDDYAIEEIKLTWLSSRHETDSKKLWKYWVQLKAYCHMIETRLGRLHVCYVNGDYRAERGPTYRKWEVEFTGEELHENWRMLITNGEVMRGEGAQ